MKNKKTWLIGAIVLVAVVGGALYFGNTQLQKGAFKPFSPSQPLKQCVNGRVLYLSQSNPNYNPAYTTYEDFSKAILGNQIGCPVVIALSNSRGSSDQQIYQLICNPSDLKADGAHIYCEKKISTGETISVSTMKNTVQNTVMELSPERTTQMDFPVFQVNEVTTQFHW